MESIYTFIKKCRPLQPSLLANAGSPPKVSEEPEDTTGEEETSHDFFQTSFNKYFGEVEWPDDTEDRSNFLFEQMRNSETDRTVMIRKLDYEYRIKKFPRKMKIKALNEHPAFPEQNKFRWCYFTFLAFASCSKVRGEDHPECKRNLIAAREVCLNDWVERWSDERSQGKFSTLIHEFENDEQNEVLTEVAEIVLGEKETPPEEFNQAFHTLEEIHDEKYEAPHQH
eukprot:TRINITY_DN1500_c0_g1_i1.p1 TRINITY_DN1500_c0_g1~~TRINITY_DN1500_c0_g1_i1.p1  ORF type:complete len:226 (-),score=49.07 TRINITY_DN1500_c0_g1_i1:80-757(-)